MNRFILAWAALATPSTILAQEQVPADEMARRIEALEALVDAMADDLDKAAARDNEELVPNHGLDARAARVYSLPEGVSLGGYGELVYDSFDGDSETDQFDLLRAVLYVGYKFDQNWVFNSEIEVEHGDEIYAEFAYIDYLHQESLNARAGLVLLPMGFVNRLHEPGSYLGATRPLNESWVIPTTWRENGAGIYGKLEDFDYELYLVNGFDGSDFGGTSGLRGGRQKGSKAKAEDFAMVGSLEWKGSPGVVLGGSIYQGDAGQGGGAGALETTIIEAHAEYRRGPIWARALVSDASVDDRDAGDMDLGGWYAEIGYDLLGHDDRRSLYPYLRYESIDTDTGAVSLDGAPGVEDDVLSIGLHWQPHPQIVFKLQHSDYDDLDRDVTTLMMGYVF